ncbi:MAG: alpha-galactosidase [bacterium]
MGVERLESGNLALNFDVEGGGFDVVSETGDEVLKGAVFGVGCYGGAREFYSTDAVEREVARDGGAMVLRFGWEQSGLSVRFIASPERGGFSIRLVVENRGEKDLRGVDFYPLMVDGRRGGTLFGAGRHDYGFLRHGMLTWSWTGVCRSDDVVSPPLLRILHDTTDNPAVRPSKERGHFTGEWFGVVCDAAANRCLLAGFVTADRQFSQVDFKTRGDRFHHLRAVSRGEGKVVRPGGELASEELLVMYDAADDADSLPGRCDGLLKGYADVTAARMKAIGWERPPVGWCSWYYYYWKISEEKILKNLEAAKELRLQLPIEYFQIDDGYQKALGDWLVPNDKFPHGMGWLAERIHDAGFKAGLWLAPFFAETSSELFRRHRDWFLRRDANRLRWGGLWLRNLRSAYPLDTTNPEVLRWLREVFETVCRKWGYDFVKIDFIYNAALDGLRHDEEATRAEAFRSGLEAVRSGAGEGKFILGCGSPQMAAVGLVNGMRISGDTSPNWEDWIPKAVGYRAGPGVRPAAHVSAHRYFSNGRLWVSDPDVLMTRFRRTRLTSDEILTHATVIGLMGGLLLISDDLARLTQESIVLAQKFTPPLAYSATPLDMFEGGAPSLFALKPEGDYGGGVVAGMINWEGSAREMEVSVRRLGLPEEGRYHVFDFWRERYCGVASRVISAGRVRAHEAKLLAVRPVRDVPHLIASTFHFTMGGVEVTEHEYDGAGKRLRVRLDIPGERTGNLYFFVPAGMTPVHCVINRTHEAALERGRGGLYSLSLDVEDGAEVLIEF